MSKQPDFISEQWIQHQRRIARASSVWCCSLCSDQKAFSTEEELWSHATSSHPEQLPAGAEDLLAFRKSFDQKCFQRNEQATKANHEARGNALSAEPQFSNTKRPLGSPVPFQPTRSLSGLGVGSLNISSTPGLDDVIMKDVSEEDQATSDQPRKRVATGDRMSAGSGSPLRSPSPPTQAQRSKALRARPISAPYGSSSDKEGRRDVFDQRPQAASGRLWNEQDAPPLKGSSFDPSNVASNAAQKLRSQALQARARQTAQPNFNVRSTNPPTSTSTQANTVKPSPAPHFTIPGHEESYDIILQPETRPISQEQLVAEVKGIYAGLVMVEAKCIEVDNKQATLAQADPSAQPKLNNEQWQALIALHRTLLHEHHDFFLASQHPSASPALRRLASKYAMPARMWRHGIHSFLELLRHRLPASLDHMLAFIYLAYSMMALLYETVPAFEDTWIECLGDLGRYRMAIEDDDIRDREVWTGVARHWYSKASDKAPTTGRLYHHLAILARPNALQQLYYYSKSLCVATPFTSARESILTLFEPVLNADQSQGHQYRLPPLDTAFVKAHGLLFTNRDMEKFDSTVQDFLGLLDNQIGRVTRKFMEQGYHIAVSNCVAMMGFGAKDAVLMKAFTETNEEAGSPMNLDTDDSSKPMAFYKYAFDLSNSTFKIVLARIGDPNVLPFIHVMLVFIYNMGSHPAAMRLLEDGFPWELLARYLNTLLAAHGVTSRIQGNKFPQPSEKEDARPFPEDFAMRGLIFAERYYPDGWFTNEKIDEEEKNHERASMTPQRKERLLFLAFQIIKLGPWLAFEGGKFVGTMSLQSRSLTSLTFASATTDASLDRASTWSPTKAGYQSETEDDLPLPLVPIEDPDTHD